MSQYHTERGGWGGSENFQKSVTDFWIVPNKSKKKYLIWTRFISSESSKKVKFFVEFNSYQISVTRDSTFEVWGRLFPWSEQIDEFDDFQIFVLETSVGKDLKEKKKTKFFSLW